MAIAARGTDPAHVMGEPDSAAMGFFCRSADTFWSCAAAREKQAQRRAKVVVA
jgi:hypothetical protein